jgi:DNA polymerase
MSAHSPLAAQLYARLSLDRRLGVKFIALAPATRAAWLAAAGKKIDKKNGAETGEEKIDGKIFAAPRVPVNNGSTASGATATPAPRPPANVAAPLPPEHLRQTEPRLTGDAEKSAACRAQFAEICACRACALGASRRQVVFGEGNLDARLMFVGDYPGKDEEFVGRPFVGNGGQLLTDIIEKGMKIPVGAVFLTTLVKCRPPGNRPLKPDESAACAEFLRRQIATVKPRVVIAAGQTAGQILSGRQADLAALRGQNFQAGDATVVVTYSPVFLWQMRRKYGRGNDYDRQTWEDIQRAMRELG